MWLPGCDGRGGPAITELEREGAVGIDVEDVAVERALARGYSVVAAQQPGGAGLREHDVGADGIACPVAADDCVGVTRPWAIRPEHRPFDGCLFRADCAAVGGAAGSQFERSVLG